MRAAIYTRISLDKSGKRAGVERQRVDCEALCARRGWSIVAYHEDNDRSAFSGRERPEYERLLASVAAGDVDVVVAWHSDRLWRSVLEQELFQVVGRDAGLQLVATPSADFNPSDGDDSFMSTLLAAVAQKESADKRRRVKRLHAHKAGRGEFWGGPPGYGYRLEDGNLVVEPDEAEVIRDAAARLLAGESTRSIVMDFIGRGMVTSTGKVWRVDTLSRLMQSPRIAGLRHDENGNPVVATWQPIIDRRTHDRIVALFDARRRGPQTRTARKYLLSGMLRCGKCGGPMTSVPVRNVPRYRCLSPGLGGCQGVVIVQHHADAETVRKVLEYLDSPKLTKALKRAQQAADKTESRISVLADRLRDDRAQLVELGDAYADGTLDRAEYRRLTERLRSRIDDAEMELARGATSGPAAVNAGQGEMLRMAWEHMTLEERRQVLGAVVDKVIIEPATRPYGVFNPGRVQPRWRW